MLGCESMPRYRLPTWVKHAGYFYDVASVSMRWSNAKLSRVITPKKIYKNIYTGTRTRTRDQTLDFSVALTPDLHAPLIEITVFWLSIKPMC